MLLVFITVPQAEWVFSDEYNLLFQKFYIILVVFKRRNALCLPVLTHFWNFLTAITLSRLLLTRAGGIKTAFCYFFTAILHLQFFFVWKFNSCLFYKEFSTIDSWLALVFLFICYSVMVVWVIHWCITLFFLLRFVTRKRGPDKNCHIKFNHTFLHLNIRLYKTILAL